MAVSHEQALAWLRSREAGHAAVALVEADELRSLDPRTALAQSDALLSLAAAAAPDPERLAFSGLVVQQQLFARARR